jgi:hypothetical protein
VRKQRAARARHRDHVRAAQERKRNADMADGGPAAAPAIVYGSIPHIKPLVGRRKPKPGEFFDRFETVAAYCNWPEDTHVRKVKAYITGAAQRALKSLQERYQAWVDAGSNGEPPAGTRTDTYAQLKGNLTKALSFGHKKIGCRI